MQCREFREIADSYLSNELMVETNPRVIAHLEQCAECRQELKARRELRGKLREAFITVAGEPIACGIRCRLTCPVA
jgi:anti-sigma factor RsiW